MKTTDNATKLLKENIYLKQVIEVLEKEKNKYKLQNNKAIECINYYAIENEDYSKLYNVEEEELLKILKGDDK